MAGGRVVEAASWGASAYDFDTGVQVRSQGQTQRVCLPGAVCLVSGTGGYAVASVSSDRGEPDAFNRLYVVTEGPSSVHFSGHGWILQPRPLTFRYATASSSSSNGLFTGLESLEEQDSTAARGGRSGSIAAATPPCSTSGLGYLPRGIGTATLTGGQHSASLTCPANVGVPFMTQLARSETLWHLTGPVVGDASGFNVPLFVLDLPLKP